MKVSELNNIQTKLVTYVRKKYLIILSNGLLNQELLIKITI